MFNLNPIDWPKFAAHVKAAKCLLLISHVRPDCDALGSELGLAAGLRKLGKEVHIINGHPTPPNLAFIDPQKYIKQIDVDIKRDALPAFDAAIVLDTSAWAQLGPMGDVLKSLNCKKLLVDHHMSEDELGTENFKNTSAEATGRLMVEALDALGVALDEEIASALFAAIATDTGWFRFNSATGDTYRVTSRLIDAGASPSQIYANLYEQDTLGRVKLRGEILARVTAEESGRLVHTYVLKEDFSRLGALPSDTEDAINLALAVKGTEVAVIFVEQMTGGFKISLRSRSKVDCSTLAQKFGGGGHKAAAGAFAEGDLKTAQARVLDAVRAAMQ
jgi:bifunctional oligoribonuclease and PAP phosphatase NrnA